MKILTPGHKYELANFENKESPGQILQFIEKIQAGPSDTGPLSTVHNGTTNEEVLAMLIDRLKFLGEKVPCRENSIAVTKCQEALLWLEKRTADRKARGVEGTRAA
jgi:hypothetical protein